VPQDIILSNKIIDLFNEGIVHYFNGFIGKPVITGSFSLPDSVVP
jgi:hypothetical protein